MQFWSTGLGKRCMSVDIGKEKISISEGKVLLTGIVKPPLSWQYTIAMDGNDWVEFFQTAFHPTIILYLIKPRKWKILLKAGINLFLFFTKYISFLPKIKMECLSFKKGSLLLADDASNSNISHFRRSGNLVSK